MNKSIELMVKEHENISRGLLVIRNMCLSILAGNEVEAEDHRRMIDFVRNYADKHHHGKEEKHLFPMMVEKLGTIADNLVTHGMLVEHDLGRAHVRAWETALNEYEERPAQELKLDIMTEAMAYAHLLKIHIEKENNVVYSFAERSLSVEDLDELNKKCDEVEKEESDKGIQDKYLGILEKMERKYNS